MVQVVDLPCDILRSAAYTYSSTQPAPLVSPLWFQVHRLMGPISELSGHWAKQTSLELSCPIHPHWVWLYKNGKRHFECQNNEAGQDLYGLYFPAIFGSQGTQTERCVVEVFQSSSLNKWYVRMGWELEVDTTELWETTRSQWDREKS